MRVFGALTVMYLATVASTLAASTKGPSPTHPEIFGIQVGVPTKWEDCTSTAKPSGEFCFARAEHGNYAPIFRDALPFPFSGDDLKTTLDTKNGLVDEIRIDFPEWAAKDYIAPFVRKFGKPESENKSSYVTAKWHFSSGDQIYFVVDHDLGRGFVSLESSRSIDARLKSARSAKLQPKRQF